MENSSQAVVHPMGCQNGHTLLIYRVGNAAALSLVHVEKAFVDTAGGLDIANEYETYDVLIF